jgi:hypothetical protein
MTQNEDIKKIGETLFEESSVEYDLIRKIKIHQNNSQYGFV